MYYISIIYDIFIIKQNILNDELKTPDYSTDSIL